MKMFFTLLLILIIGSIDTTYAQNSEQYEEQEKPILVGKFTWENWQKAMHWSLDSNHSIDPEQLNKLTNSIKQENITFLLFAGSWCGDSRDELPKIMKIFESISLDTNRYELLGVDRQKFEPSGRFMDFNIERVPTLIVLKDGKEIGRIVEHPKKEWVDDILRIIK